MQPVPHIRQPENAVVEHHDRQPRARQRRRVQHLVGHDGLQEASDVVAVLGAGPRRVPAQAEPQPQHRARVHADGAHAGREREPVMEVEGALGHAQGGVEARDDGEDGEDEEDGVSGIDLGGAVLSEVGGGVGGDRLSSWWGGDRIRRHYLLFGIYNRFLLSWFWFCTS